MGARLSKLFPFAIAVILPPAGLIVGLAALQQDRELGLWLIAVAVMATVVWALVFLG